MTTAAEKVARYEKRMREKGFRKVHLWVPDDRADELADIAGRMRRAKESARVRKAVLATLRGMEGELRARGVARLALFGSLARGEAGPDSDVDLVADIDPAAKVNILDLIGIGQDIEDALGRGVDLVARDGLRDSFAAEIAADEIEVF